MIWLHVKTESNKNQVEEKLSST